MDLIKNLIGDQMPGLISTVTERTSLDAAQAGRFVPEAAGSVVDAAKELGSGLDLSNPAAAAQAVIGKVDVAALASRAGIDAASAQAGLGAVAPQLMSLIESKAGGLSGLLSMLGGAKAGGLGGMLGGLGKKLGM